MKTPQSNESIRNIESSSKSNNSTEFFREYSLDDLNPLYIKLGLDSKKIDIQEELSKFLKIVKSLNNPELKERILSEEYLSEITRDSNYIKPLASLFRTIISLKNPNLYFRILSKNNTLNAISKPNDNWHLSRKDFCETVGTYFEFLDGLENDSIKIELLRLNSVILDPSLKLIRVTDTINFVYNMANQEGFDQDKAAQVSSIVKDKLINSSTKDKLPYEYGYIQSLFQLDEYKSQDLFELSKKLGEQQDNNEDSYAKEINRLFVINQVYTLTKGTQEQPLEQNEKPKQTEQIILDEVLAPYKTLINQLSELKQEESKEILRVVHKIIEKITWRHDPSQLEEYKQNQLQLLDPQFISTMIDSLGPMETSKVLNALLTEFGDSLFSLKGFYSKEVMLNPEFILSLSKDFGPMTKETINLILSTFNYSVKSSFRICSYEF